MHYLSLRVSGYNSKRPTCKISSGLKPSHGFHWKGLWEVNFGSWIWSMPSFTAEWRNFSPYEWDQRSKSSKKSEPKNFKIRQTPGKRNIFDGFFPCICCLFSPSITFIATLLQVCCSLGFRGSTGTCAPSRALAAQTSPELLRRGSFEPRLGLRHTAIIATAPSKSYGISTVWNQWLKSGKKNQVIFFGGRGVVEGCFKMMHFLFIYNYVYCSMIYWLYNYI